MDCIALAQILLLVISVSEMISADKTVGYAVKLPENGPSACESKGIPSWLDGYFLQQICGGFGPFGASNFSHLTHLFDCMGMVASYDFSGGEATFSNRYYHTKPYAVWNASSQNMVISKVSWGTMFSAIDQEGYTRNLGKFKDSPALNPNIAFWKIGSRVEAVAEVQKGYEFEPASLGMKGLFTFGDTNMGFGSNMIFIDNPAHPQVDQNGTIYSVVMGFEALGGDKYNVRRIVYKIEPEVGNRTVVANIHTSSVELSSTNCVPFSDHYIYNSQDFQEGYVHSFAMTEHYIVIPITSYFFNPCFFYPEARTKALPFFATWWFFDQTLPSKFLVIDKSTGELVKTFTVSPALFITHNINAYENEQGHILLDFVGYKTSNVFTKYTQLSFLMHRENYWPQEAAITRYTLDVTDTDKWYAPSTLTKESTVAAEYPQINNYFRGKDYRYAYMVKNPYAEKSHIVKYDVVSKNELIYEPGDDVYPSEPIFVQTPGNTGEDQGVLLVGGFNSTSRKGLVMVVDAETMKELGTSESPHLTTFGRHSIFVPRRFGASSSPQLLASIPIFTFSILLLAERISAHDF